MLVVAHALQQVKRKNRISIESFSGMIDRVRKIMTPTKSIPSKRGVIAYHEYISELRNTIELKYQSKFFIENVGFKDREIEIGDLNSIIDLKDHSTGTILHAVRRDMDLMWKFAKKYQKHGNVYLRHVDRLYKRLKKLHRDSDPELFAIQREFEKLPIPADEMDLDKYRFNGFSLSTKNNGIAVTSNGRRSISFTIAPLDRKGLIEYLDTIQEILNWHPEYNSWAVFNGTRLDNAGEVFKAVGHRGPRLNAMALKLTDEAFWNTHQNPFLEVTDKRRWDLIHTLAEIIDRSIKM